MCVRMSLPPGPSSINAPHPSSGDNGICIDRFQASLNRVPRLKLNRAGCCRSAVGGCKSASCQPRWRGCAGLRRTDVRPGRAQVQIAVAVAVSERSGDHGMEEVSDPVRLPNAVPHTMCDCCRQHENNALREVAESCASSRSLVESQHDDKRPVERAGTGS